MTAYTQRKSCHVRADEKIQRILDRLDQGEELISGKLKLDGKFCVLGLFAEESGLGKWSKVVKDGVVVSYYTVRPMVNGCGQYGYVFSYNYYGSGSATRLDRRLMNHYGLRSPDGSFDIELIPPVVKALVQTVKCADSLSGVNDRLIELEYDGEVVNKVLADIIRSGAIFKDKSNAKT